MQMHIHTQTYKQKWNYLVKQSMLSLFRPQHSKAQQHRTPFLSDVFQLQNKSCELKDIIWQFLANHGGKWMVNHPPTTMHFVYLCHILAMPILRQHKAGAGSHAIRKNLATETAMIHYAF